MRNTLVEECVGKMRLNVRKGSLVGGVRATLGPDVTLDYGLVFAYCACSGHRILQETLSGFIYTLWVQVIERLNHIKNKRRA